MKILDLFESDVNLPAMLLLLKSRNACPMIGEEKGKFNKDGISVFFHSTGGKFGSYRFVYAIDGRIVSAIQVMSSPEKNVLSNAITDPEFTRKGYASRLANAAKKLFGNLEFSDDQSEDGKAFTQSLITEAPIADFDIYNDTGEEGSFRDQDLKAMSNPKWVHKVKNILNKTPYDFNLYLMNTPDGRMPASQGDRSLKTMSREYLIQETGPTTQQRFEYILGKAVPNWQSSINIMLTNNEGDERIALTPWIVAHRVIHAFLKTNSMSNQINNHLFWFRDIMNFTRELGYSYDYAANSKPSQDALFELFSKIGKPRSMTDNNISRSGEIIIELFTQYLISGLVTFQNVDQLLNDLASKVSNPYQTEKYNNFKKQLDVAASKYNSEFEAVLKSVVGNFFIL